MAPADLTEASRRYRAGQLLTATTLVRDLLRMFRALFNTSRPEHAWPEVRAAVGLLIRERRAESAGLAVPYYQEVRDLSGLPELPELPELAAPRRPGALPRAGIAAPRALEADRLDSAVDGAGIASFKKSLRSGATPEKARDRAAVNLSGTATRLALEGGRQVIHDTAMSDDDMIGWARVTDADPCSWCAMLASRGAVFKDERTAGRAKNDRFVGEGAFKYHDHCGCVAVPVASPDDPHLLAAEELYDQWRSATAGTSGKAALLAWRRHWESRESGATESSDPGRRARPPIGGQEPPQPPEPQVSVSAETRRKIDAAIAELPSTDAEWDQPVKSTLRRIDVSISEAQASLAEDRRELERQVADVEAEFKRKRTPRHRRDELMEERTRDAASKALMSENRLVSLRGLASKDPAEMSDYDRRFLEIEDGFQYPLDENGQQLAPQEYEQHLDTVLKVGGAILDDAREVFRDDPELNRLGTDPASRAAIARRESVILRELLSSVRPMAGHQQRTGDVEDGVRSDWQALLREAETVYPTDWLRHADSRGPMQVARGDRAYFLPGFTDRMAFDASTGDRGGGFSSYGAEVTAHELGHRMEEAIPGLTHLEFTLVRRRSLQDGVLEPPSKLRDVSGNTNYGEAEVTYEDQWPNPYAGKTYEATIGDHPASSAWEIFQVGVQDTFGRSTVELAGEDGQRLVLGALAVLGRDV